MKKSVKRLHLSRETVQNLNATDPELRFAGAAGTAGSICTRLMICTQTCGHICP
ncbi:MAG TPA: hypothetical protein VKY89_22565 [Thermoanaerobaculia bacterium]|nr:hypothetical protein [Thermoanaerobaculia bacterium]